MQRVNSGVGNIVMSLTGKLDPARLERAFRLSFDAEPLVGCRFENRWFNPCWLRRNDLDQLVPCTLVDGPPETAELVSFLSAAIDPSRDPLVRAVLFRGLNDTLCIKFSHVVGDGPAMVQYLSLLAELYRRLNDDPHYTPSPNLRGTRNMRDISRRFTWSEKRRMVSEVRRRFAAARNFWRLPQPPGDGRRRGYLIWKLPPARVQLLSRYGRDRRSTMTSVMLAGYFRALQQVLSTENPGLSSIGTTTDLRRFLPPELRRTPLANLSGPCRFWLEDGVGMSFDDTLVSMRDQLKILMRDPTQSAVCPQLLATIPPLNLLFALMPFFYLTRKFDALAGSLMSKTSGHAVLVNLGEFELDSLDFGGVRPAELCCTGGIYEGGAVGALFCQYRGALILSMGFSSRLMDESTTLRLLDRLDQELPFQSAGRAEVVSHMLTLPPAAEPDESTFRGELMELPPLTATERTQPRKTF